MNTQEIKDSLGKVVICFDKIMGRIIDVREKYVLLDFPEKRSYYTNGKLMPCVHRKIYFDTKNVMWNISVIRLFENQEYKFKLKRFQPDVLHVNKRDIELNNLPTLEESRKSKAPVYRRDKNTIERDKLFNRK